MSEYVFLLNNNLFCLDIHQELYLKIEKKLLEVLQFLQHITQNKQKVCQNGNIGVILYNLFQLNR